jgi:hypothetical protein
MSTKNKIKFANVHIDPWKRHPFLKFVQFERTLPLRVTRLGEFSSLWWLFTLGSILITEEAQIIVLLFSTVQVMY